MRVLLFAVTAAFIWCAPAARAQMPYEEVFDQPVSATAKAWLDDAVEAYNLKMQAFARNWLVGATEPHTDLRRLASEQGFKAAELFQEVTAVYGTANVTLTGHSLGGGLASLRGVYFDRPAYVFAPAPFEAAADGNQLVYLQGIINSSLGATRAY